MQTPVRYPPLLSCHGSSEYRVRLNAMVCHAGQQEEREPWPCVHSLNCLRMTFNHTDLALDSSGFFAQGASLSKPCRVCSTATSIIWILGVMHLQRRWMMGRLRSECSRPAGWDASSIFDLKPNVRSGRTQLDACDFGLFPWLNF